MNRLNDCIEKVQIQSESSILHLFIAVHVNRRSPLETSSPAGQRLYPFSPDKVLREIQKPLAELYVPKDDEVKVESCPQGTVLQTPVTSEALTLLRSRIEHDAHVLDGSSKHCLQKLANVAEKAFPERALLLDENRFLFEQNNESNYR